jgi:pilus assembly protein Flp/PilA
MRYVQRFFQNEDGAVSMEYALIGGMISILIITGVSSIGTTINSMFFGPIGAALGGASP